MRADIVNWALVFSVSACLLCRYESRANVSDGINVAKRAKIRIFVLMLSKPTVWNSREIVRSQEH